MYQNARIVRNRVTPDVDKQALVSSLSTPLGGAYTFAVLGQDGVGPGDLLGLDEVAQVQEEELLPSRLDEVVVVVVVTRLPGTAVVALAVLAGRREVLGRVVAGRSEELVEEVDVGLRDERRLLGREDSELTPAGRIAHRDRQGEPVAGIDPGRTVAQKAHRRGSGEAVQAGSHEAAGQQETAQDEEDSYAEIPTAGNPAHEPGVDVAGPVRDMGDEDEKCRNRA